MSIEVEQLGRLVKCLQHRHHRALDTRLARLGTSLVQWNALREIDRNPGCTQHQLAECTFNSDQAFGTLATRLKKRGLIAPRPGGGRALTHVLTPKGAALLRKGRKVMTAVITQSFAPLNKRERAELTRLLLKVLGSC